MGSSINVITPSHICVNSKYLRDCDNLRTREFPHCQALSIMQTQFTKQWGTVCTNGYANNWLKDFVFNLNIIHTTDSISITHWEINKSMLCLYLFLSKWSSISSQHWCIPHFALLSNSIMLFSFLLLPIQEVAGQCCLYERSSLSLKVEKFKSIFCGFSLMEIGMKVNLRWFSTTRH